MMMIFPFKKTSFFKFDISNLPLYFIKFGINFTEKVALLYASNLSHFEKKNEKPP